MPRLSRELFYTYESIRGFTETFAKESLSQEDYDVMSSYIEQIEDIVELTDKNVKAIESKSTIIGGNN